MKLVSLHVRSFGKLQNFKLDFKNNLTVIQRQNSFGKTTLAAFVRAMLYGLDYTRNKRNNEWFTEFGLWQTWNSNEKIGGSLVVEHNGELFRIERYFGPTAKQSTLSVVNEKSGQNLPFDPKVQEVGEYFLGLSAASFDRSVYYPQEAVEMATNTNFDSKLAGLVQNADNFIAVQSGLRDSRRELRAERGHGGKIFELEEKLLQVEREIAACEKAQYRQSEIEKRLKQIVDERSRLKNDLELCNERIATLQRAVAQTQPDERLQVARQKLQQLDERLNRLKGFEQDKARLDELAQKINATPDAAKTQRHVSKPLLISGAVAIVLGTVLMVLLSKIIAVGLVVAAVGVILFTVSFFVKPGIKTLQSGEKDALITQYFNIAQKYVFVGNLDYSSLQKALWQAYSDYLGDKREYDVLFKTVTPLSDTDNVIEREQLLAEQNKLTQISLQQQRLAHEEGELSEEQKRLNVDKLPLVEQQIQLKCSIAEAKHRYDILTKTSELLDKAKENLSVSYLPSLCNKCTVLLNQMVGGDSVYEVVLNRELSVQLRFDGLTKSLDNFSRGIREITLLCCRLALSQMLFDGDIPFLIVDDAFVNFDEQNFLRATAILKNLSQRTQIVYLTCHDRLGNLN